MKLEIVFFLKNHETRKSLSANLISHFSDVDTRNCLYFDFYIFYLYFLYFMINKYFNYLSK